MRGAVIHLAHEEGLESTRARARLPEHALVSPERPPATNSRRAA